MQFTWTSYKSTHKDPAADLRSSQRSNRRTDFMFFYPLPTQFCMLLCGKCIRGLAPNLTRSSIATAESKHITNVCEGLFFVWGSMGAGPDHKRLKLFSQIGVFFVSPQVQLSWTLMPCASFKNQNGCARCIACAITFLRFIWHLLTSWRSAG